MDRHLGQNTFLDSLIADYGADIGIPDLAFDDEGLIGLSINGVEITLFRLGSTTNLMAKALLETETDLTPVAGPLAGLNLRSLEAGVGIVGYDEDQGSWVWGDRIEARGMTITDFASRLENAARHVVFWAEQIATLIDDNAPDETPTDTRTAG